YLARQTYGKFYHARQASDLRLQFKEISEELQTAYTVTFKSRRPVHDGTSRGVDVSVVRSGARGSNVASTDYAVHGIVVPDVEQGVYRVLLALLTVLLVFPAGIRRLYRFYGGA